MSIYFYLGAAIVGLVVLIDYWRAPEVALWAKIVVPVLFCFLFLNAWPFLVIGYVVLLFTMRVTGGRATSRWEN